MATRAVDERRLIEANFILVARNLGWNHTTIWRRDDEPDVTFSEDEALQWLELEGKKKRSRNG